jgi:mono/diheme cytochrome c family protein
MINFNKRGWRRGGLALALVLPFGLSAVAGAKAQDVGDPVAGRQLAMAWCANCHAFTGNTQTMVTGAPSFSAIAANHAITPLSLRAFLQTTHDRMPDLQLSNNEMDDLIAFVLSSREK